MKLKKLKNDMDYYIRDKVLVFRKLTEKCINDVVFILADVNIVIVHKLTWTDQNNILSLNKRIEEWNSENYTRPKSKVIIIHNYKDISSESQFNYLTKRYIEDIFLNGYWTTRPVFVDGELTISKSYVSDEGLNHHFILLDDNSPFGNKFNKCTFQDIRHNIISTHVAKRSSLLNYLAKCAYTALKNSIQSNLHLVKYVWDTEKNELYLRAFNKDKEKNIEIKRADIDISGNSVYLMDSSFELHMDKLFFPKNNVPKYMCIIDLPGFRNSSYRKDMSTSTIKNEKSFFKIFNIFR